MAIHKQRSKSEIKKTLSVNLGLTYHYFIISSITTFDIRLIQAKKSGLLTLSEQLPKWVAIIHWIEIVILITIILLNWKVAIVVYLVRFVLKVLPVLETIGNIIMSPFKIKS